MSATSSGRRSLVTGAGGFIGSHLVEALVRRGDRVRGFVRYNSRGSNGCLDELPADVRADVEIVAGDLKDPDAVAEAVRGCDVIFHLGALIGIPYSYVHPVDYVQTNVDGTVNVLTAAQRASVSRVIHTSTSEVYGTAQYLPIDEEHPLQPQSPYSASKIGGDMLALSYHRSFDLPIAVIRPFNTFGPRQSLRAVIPTIISQALGDGPVALGSLAPRRDFTFVSDTVRGFVLAAAAEDVVGKVINLGSGRSVTIGELAALIESLLGKRTAIVEDAARIRPHNSEVFCLEANNAQAQRVLGWRPETSLEDGLRRTIDWMSARSGQARTDVYHV
jgi:dTDP-glucose 4,6-dehydratase